MTSLDRRSLLKGALAIPLATGGKATGNSHVEPLSGWIGAVVDPSNGFAAQPVSRWSGKAIEVLWGSVADLAHKRFEARRVAMIPFPDNRRFCVFATCYLCGEYDFAENVPDRDGPVWTNVCNDCWDDLPTVLSKLALLSFAPP